MSGAEWQEAMELDVEGQDGREMGLVVSAAEEGSVAGLSKSE